MSALPSNSVMLRELVSVGRASLSVPLIVSMHTNDEINKNMDGAHMITLTSWLINNPGLYRMTKTLVEALAVTSNVVIDDEESGIITTTPMWSRMEKCKVVAAKRRAVTHTLSRLMLTRPQRVHRTETSKSTCTSDVVFPDPTNKNSYDVGGWWSAFSYISKNGQEHDYKGMKIVYKPYPNLHDDAQIHRADDGVCGPDAYVAHILSVYKQAIVDRDFGDTDMHYVLVTIAELNDLIRRIEQPDFKSIVQLKHWLNTIRPLIPYVNTAVTNLVVNGVLKSPDDQHISDTTLLAIVQRQTPAAQGDHVVWLGEETPWCTFVCKSKEKAPDYYMAGKLTVELGKGDTRVDIKDSPVAFPEREKHYMYQRDVDYHEYILCNYRDGNYARERYYCVILPLKELKDIVQAIKEEAEKQRRRRSEYEDDADCDY